VIALRGLHPEVRAAAEWALSWATYYGVPVTVTSTVRSWEEQARLRARWEAAGRPSSCVSTPTGTVCPANLPGDSSHAHGLSWDSVTEPWAQDWWDHVRTLAGFFVPSHDRIHAEVPSWRQFV
jgi:hypothetical protein